MRVLPEESFPTFFSASQRGFAQSWYSLTNVQSLDSHRVRTLNARLVLRELIAVCTLVESGIIHYFHREAVAQEAAYVLDQDPIYTREFAPDWRVLRPCLHAPECCKGKEPSRAVELRVIAEDALSRTDERYFEILLTELKSAIDADSPINIILGITSALLTDLTDRGFSISNLYGFHSFFVAGNQDSHGSERSFDVRFRYLVQWLKRPREPHEIVLRLSNARKLAALRKFGDWEFESVVEQVRSGNRDESAFLRPGAQVVFAKREVEARDHREAGAIAIRSWSSVTDQLLFDFISERLPLDSKYRSTRLRDRRVDIGVVQLQIPNPREWDSEKHLREFSQQIEAVLSDRCKLRDEDKRQIEAAMRYFRLGTESSSLEAMFLTRWIALETLLRTVQPDDPTQGICRSISHLMAVGYPQRVSNDLASTARFLRRPLPSSLSQLLERSDTTDLTASQLADIIKDPGRRSSFCDLFQPWPLYVASLTSYGVALGDPKTLADNIRRHEEHVRWQVQRMYRIRNEIVHSASHSISLLSLVSHLEYYFRITTRTVLEVLCDAPHVRSLRDLFHRVSARKTRLDEELKAKTIPPDLHDPAFTHG